MKRFLVLVPVIVPQTGLPDVIQLVCERVPLPPDLRKLFADTEDDAEAIIYCKQMHATSYRVWFLPTMAPVCSSDGPAADEFYLLPRVCYGPVCVRCHHAFVQAPVTMCAVCCAESAAEHPPAPESKAN